MRIIAQIITPRYKLLGSFPRPYATKHKIAPAHKRREKGVINYSNKRIGQGVPSFSLSLFGPSTNNFASASCVVKPVLIFVFN